MVALRTMAEVAVEVEAPEVLGGSKMGGEKEITAEEERDEITLFENLITITIEKVLYVLNEIPPLED